MYLGVPLVRAAAAVGRPEAEAAGAALRVCGVQVERTNSALVASGTLDVLLWPRWSKTQEVRTWTEGATCVCVSVLPHLAETLSCQRVTHVLLCPRLVAVTWPAVGVTIETGSAVVTLTANDVVLAAEKKKVYV